MVCLNVPSRLSKVVSQDGRRKPTIESNAVLSKISHYSADNNGNPTSQLLMKRRIRSRLDLLNPILSKKVFDTQNIQKMHHDYHAHDRTFDIGDSVLCQNNGICDELPPGHIIVKSGPVSFQIKLNDGRIMNRHQDQIRHRHCAEEPPNKLPEVTIPPTIPMNIPKITQNSTITTPMATEATIESTDAVPVAPTYNATRTTQFSPIHAKTSQFDSIANTCPKRNIREPNRLNLYLQ